MLLVSTACTAYSLYNGALLLYSGNVIGAIQYIAVDALFAFMPIGFRFIGKGLKPINYLVQTKHVFGKARAASWVLNHAAKITKGLNYFHYTLGYSGAVKNVARAGKMAFNFVSKWI